MLDDVKFCKIFENLLIQDGMEIPLPDQGSIDLHPINIWSIRTPGCCEDEVKSL
jgi:hypothetical protein